MTILTIGEKIRKSRRDSKLSQSILSAKVGVSLRTIQRIEDDESDVGINLLKKISEATGKPINFFIEEIQSESKNINREIMEALSDPIAVKALLVAYKSSEDVKRTIRSLLEGLSNMPEEKKKAILTLCR